MTKTMSFDIHYNFAEYQNMYTELSECCTKRKLRVCAYFCPTDTAPSGSRLLMRPFLILRLSPVWATWPSL